MAKKEKDQTPKGKAAASSQALASSSNPYPWMEDWYYELHKDEFAAFDRFVVGVVELGTARGFTMRVGARTGPQYGSAGTVTFYAECSPAGINSSRYVDDRLALSFGTDYARFLRWWLGTDFCSRPIVVEPPPGEPRERTIQTGRYIPRNPVRVFYRAMRVLFAV